MPPRPKAATSPSSSHIKRSAAARSPSTPRLVMVTEWPSKSSCCLVSRVEEPSETLTTSGTQQCKPRRAHAVAGSCQQLGVPIEYRPSVDGERVAEPLPEAAGPRVTAVDAGEHAPRVPVEASFEVTRARSADAVAL